MRILITGAYGQLGISLNKILSINHEVYNSGINVSKNKNGFHLNIQDRVQVKTLINHLEPELIINLAALTNVDLCESNDELAYEVNTNGVRNIYDCFKGKIIQLSTDYVFDGQKGPYSEEDKTNPISVYGKTKLKAEKIILNSKENLVLRTNVLYDISMNNKASFLNWIIESLERKNKINVVIDQYNNPTWVNSICRVINLCIENNINGLFHWGDATYLSRYEFAVKIAEKFNYDSNLINKILTKDLGQIAPRPLLGGLEKDSLENILNIKAPSLDECLNKIFMSRKK
jgi:dTDP-4-dehydrorhamnose reductase